jgi:hypothetical protein
MIAGHRPPGCVGGVQPGQRLHDDAVGRAERYEFDKRSWKRVRTYFGNDVKSVERYRGLYAIVTEGRVVTVAWRNRGQNAAFQKPLPDPGRQR